MKKHGLVFAQTNRDSFEFIRKGKKKIETRAGSVRYQDIAVGDVIVFSCGDDTFEKQIKFVEHFSSIEDILKKYKPQDVNPKMKTPEDLTNLYHSFPRYEEKIKEYGLMAFTLE